MPVTQIGHFPQDGRFTLAAEFRLSAVPLFEGGIDG